MVPNAASADPVLNPDDSSQIGSLLWDDNSIDTHGHDTASHEHGHSDNGETRVQLDERLLDVLLALEEADDDDETPNSKRGRKWFQESVARGDRSTIVEEDAEE